MPSVAGSNYLRGEAIIIRTCFVVIASITLGACASSPGGRMQMTAPTSVSAVYSEVDMKLSLVTEGNTVSPCIEECQLDRAFDQRIMGLGTRLAHTAFETYPELTGRFDKFNFVVAEKAGTGSTSSAAGTVVIFRGVQKLQLSEEVLAFLIAREMGYVIGRHHDEKTATSILFSILGSVFIPGISFFSGSAVLAQTAATSTAVTSAAASFIGSKITMESYKLDQLREADAIALILLGKLEWNKNDIAEALVAGTRVMNNDSWSNDLRVSANDVFKLASVQNSITKLGISSTRNGETVIKVGLEQPLVNLPTGFTTDTPPRIVLDFPNTANGLGKSFQDFHERGLNSTHIIQASGRTRLSINLNRMLSYNTRIDGNSLLITMQDKVADTVAINDIATLGKADSAARRHANY
ncbi:MAG: AMIN domain-containing protein [Gallionella sp.]|nr:AMIN domain-containing protein [Gallionella sp.]